MQKIKVNEKFQFDVENKGTDVFINNELTNIDINIINNHTSHLIFENSSYNTEVVDINFEEKTCTVKVNGNLYSVTLEDQFDQLLKQMGLDNLNSSKVLDVKAPMPGLVLNVLVEENSIVKKGDNLLILEAMKMENIIKSPSDGEVKFVKVLKGDKVEKNQIMISFK